MTMLRLSRPHLKSPVQRTGAPKKDDLEFSRGQIIVLFAAALMVFIGIMGIAIDVSYAYVNEVRIQKSADAAALAGAVYLPDDPGTATTKSLAAAVQNGYSTGVGGVVVDAHQNAANHEQMDVTVTAPIPTFFMRAFGITSLTASRVAHAQFHLPVPMGSPLNVFGDPTATDLSGNALNFWAAVQGPCTLKANGDPYATKNTTSVSSNCSAASTSNSEYKAPATGDPGAYDYAVRVLTAGTLTIQLYDPEFCARTQTQDTGDSTFSSANFNTTFTLYNPSDTPYDLTDDTVATSKTYPGNSTYSASTSDTTDSCSRYYLSAGNSQSTYVGKYLTFASFTASVGTYRLNVQTSVVGTNAADGSNSFAIKATSASGTQPQVYAGLAGTQSAMSIYNNFSAGTSWLYLAQIKSNMAGKTMEIDLFDPGDMNGTGTMYFEMPTASSYTPATFNWRDAGTSLGPGGTMNNGVTSLVTATSGTSHFNGHWVVITTRIPADYTAPQNGWWKVKYVFTDVAHERTTWRAEIIDSPVHLVG
jgi:hypothetical protein